MARGGSKSETDSQAETSSAEEAPELIISAGNAEELETRTGFPLKEDDGFPYAQNPD